ncbi:MAG: ribosomal-processing cysteine protease Prp [Clostridium sp.]
MIRVEIQSKNNEILGFIINNHAMPGDRDFRNDEILVGETFDMICNTVSVLSQSVIIGLDEVLNLNVSYEMMDGYLKLDLRDLSQEELASSQVLLKTFEKSLESTILSLDNLLGINRREEYIKFIKEEV